jgi:hypothetical protein
MVFGRNVRAGAARLSAAPAYCAARLARRLQCWMLSATCRLCGFKHSRTGSARGLLITKGAPRSSTRSSATDSMEVMKGEPGLTYRRTRSRTRRRDEVGDSKRRDIDRPPKCAEKPFVAICGGRQTRHSLLTTATSLAMIIQRSQLQNSRRPCQRSGSHRYQNRHPFFTCRRHVSRPSRDVISRSRWLSIHCNAACAD